MKVVIVVYFILAVLQLKYEKADDEFVRPISRILYGILVHYNDFVCVPLETLMWWSLCRQRWPNSILGCVIILLFCDFCPF